MNQQYSYKYTAPGDKYCRDRDVLQAIQTPALTHRTVSNGPSLSSYMSKYECKQPTTSSTLNSYKSYSPPKAKEPAPSALDTMRRFIDIAIQNNWTKQTVNSNWEQFVAAFNHYDSKIELECFYKSMTIKPSKTRSKSQPKIQIDLQNVKKTERQKNASLHRQLSYNLPIHQQPVSKPLTKSKFDHFKRTLNVEPSDNFKSKQVREAKLLKICEQIQADLARCNKFIATKAPYY